MLSFVSEFICPKNQTLSRQAGANYVRWRRLLLLLDRLRGRTSRLQPLGTTQPEAEYEIKRWDPSANEVFITGGLADWGIERLFQVLATRGGMFVDVGAHSGYFAHVLYERSSHFLLIEP
jgi:hypothetical protein